MMKMADTRMLQSTSPSLSLPPKPLESSMNLNLLACMVIVSICCAHYRLSSPVTPAIDALIVAVEAQNLNLGNKKTWTRKVILVTDGEGPIELEDWEVTAAKMNELNVALTVVGVDFDDEEYPFKQKDKPHYKVGRFSKFQLRCSLLSRR
jgi:hypothetical protein